MSVVIDVNAFNDIFKSSNDAKFALLRRWLWSTARNAKMIYGGSKYVGEIKRMKSYLKILGEFERSRKLIRIDDTLVDALSQDYENTLPSSSKGDDPHLLALCKSGNCYIICSNDIRLKEYLALYDIPTKIQHRIFVYENDSSSVMLRDDYHDEVWNAREGTVKDLLGD